MALEPTLRSYLGPILHPAKVTGNPWLLLWPMHRIEGRDGPFLRQTRGHPDTGLGRPCLLRVLICKRVAPVQLYLIVKWCVAQSWCCTAALGAPVTFLAHLAFAWFVDLAQTPCVSCRWPGWWQELPELQGSAGSGLCPLPGCHLRYCPPSTCPGVHGGDGPVRVLVYIAVHKEVYGYKTLQ